MVALATGSLSIPKQKITPWLGAIQTGRLSPPSPPRPR
jgi:hypothetical protein